MTPKVAKNWQSIIVSWQVLLFQNWIMFFQSNNIFGLALFLFWIAHRKFPLQKIYSNHYYLAWKMRSTQKVIALAIISMAFRILCTHCIQSLHFTQDCNMMVSICWYGMFLRALSLELSKQKPTFPYTICLILWGHYNNME